MRERPGIFQFFYSEKLHILFFTNRCGIASRTYFFLACQKKVCKKEALENEMALRA